MPKQGPFNAAGQTSVVVSTINVSVATSAAVPGDGETMLVFNGSNVTVTVALDVTAPTAAAGSPVVLGAGQRIALDVARGRPLFAAAMPVAAATGSVYFMRGDGTGA